MDLVTALGLGAGTLTTAALVPQVFHTWKTKSAKDLSLPMLALVVTDLGLLCLADIAIRRWVYGWICRVS